MYVKVYSIIYIYALFMKTVIRNMVVESNDKNGNHAIQLFYETQKNTVDRSLSKLVARDGSPEPCEWVVGHSPAKLEFRVYGLRV